MFFESTFQSCAFYTGTNALIMLILSVLVVRARVTTQTAIGDGNNPLMAGPLRAHGNNTEYVPVALMLMWALLPFDGSIWLVHGVGLPLTVGRILHAMGLSGNTGPSTLRLAGMMLTWIAYIVGIVGLFYVTFIPPMMAS
ncbi:MAG: glutathione S-transferase [Alphaproteobacteria bacterium]|nr:glutathione S-transferase [Alphaproteobacteria bacterium]